MTLLNDSRKSCFILLFCSQSAEKPELKKKKTSYIINGLHPSTVYQLRALALASLPLERES